MGSSSDVTLDNKPHSPEDRPASSSLSTKSIFENGLQEAGFVVAIMLGQSFNLTPFGATLNARWLIADDLGVPGNNGQMSWIAAGFSITTGSFVLVGGRLGDVYGHRLVWLLALVWSMIWNLVSGFARSPAFYDAARGLTGIGAGLMLPTAVALLGQTYPPGRKRNLAFGLFGALAPFSAAGGAVLEVLLAQLVNPQWIWWLHAIKNALNLVIAIPSMPASIGVGQGGAVDWIGAFLGVAGLILFNFSFNQAPLAGWSSPSVIAPVVIGVIMLLLFALWEMKGAKAPILPFDIWRAPTFLAVMSSAFLSFMSFGIFIFYHIQFVHDIRGATALQSMAWLVPFTINGFIAACLVAVLISRVPAQVIFCAGLIAVMLANILTMTAPAEGSYWTFPFFAAFLAPFGPDMTFTAAQLVASNTVRRSEQGVAGSLVGTALNYGMALGIGLGGTVEAYTNAGGTKPLQGIRGAMYLGTGMAILGITIVLVFVRVPKDRRDGYDEEAEVSVKAQV
ncbi:major facilitator superfamily domain-containing protein [Mycena vulgaris]|nr:major facilitator superfamily domain-containing protein [Mycena vulgaris]KAJ6525889.1 major facilitator superfamily domain-containing protein [Mycena vulgaris]